MEPVSVWIFHGLQSRFACAVFDNVEEAEKFIVPNGLEGTLTEYPVGISSYDNAIKLGHFVPQTDEHKTNEFISRYISERQKHKHYIFDEGVYKII